MSAFGDPATQMAFSVHENKGVFALLLGSGLSRAAEIPTGWEITTDLIRRIATAQGEDEQDDWGKWYVEKEGKEPNYSELLAHLASTPAERRAILHSYIEPDEKDREEGCKVPTAGHKAIAKLVRDGYIRVIVTTNFDRLMENALREVGVEPTVITSPDVLQGAEPLTHSTCYILKLHGDYKDARILNTDEELDAYPETYNTLLDRILDEHGLIVCGWSGEWDHALRSAIQRAPNRRYPMFWASRGDLRGRSKELCESRKGFAVTITDADSFFIRLVEQVETLAQSKRQNPVGVDMLVSRAKRYLAKPEHRIQMSDLISEEIERITERLDQDDMGPRGNLTPEEFQRRVAVYEGSAEGLAKVCGLVGRWGDVDNIEQVIDGISTLIDHAEKEHSGLRGFLALRGYPAVLAYQGAVLGLVKSSNWQGIRNLLLAEIDTGRPQPEAMYSAVSPMQWNGGEREAWNKYHGTGQDLYVPLLDRLHDEIFTSWGQSFLSSMGGFTTAFLLSEMLIAFVYCDGMDKAEFMRRTIEAKQSNIGYVWMPIGRACWDRTYQERVLPKFENDTFKKGLLNAGFFGGDAEYLDLAVENYTGCVGTRRW